MTVQINAMNIQNSIPNVSLVLFSNFVRPSVQSVRRTSYDKTATSSNIEQTGQSINQKRIKVTKVTNVTARPLINQSEKD